MKRTVASRSIGRGLAKVEVLTTDTLVAYAARAGSSGQQQPVAVDGSILARICMGTRFGGSHQFHAGVEHLAEPLRARNHQQTDLRRHVDKDCNVRFGATEMKNRKRINTTVPDELLPCLVDYLEVYRPLPCGGRYFGDALWVSLHARRLSRSALYDSVVRSTQRCLGVKINPHLIRPCMAPSIAIDMPGQIDVAAVVLGHDIATLQSAYNFMASRDFA